MLRTVRCFLEHFGGGATVGIGPARGDAVAGGAAGLRATSAEEAPRAVNLGGDTSAAR